MALYVAYASVGPLVYGDTCITSDILAVTQVAIGIASDTGDSLTLFGLHTDIAKYAFETDQGDSK